VSGSNSTAGRRAAEASRHDGLDPGLIVFEPPQPTMTALDARSRLSRLQAERLDAVEAGLASNNVYMTDLRDDIAATRAAYVGLAVTEVATLRAELRGPQNG
jgi:hypothetical protein